MFWFLQQPIMKIKKRKKQKRHFKNIICFFAKHSPCAEGQIYTWTLTRESEVVKWVTGKSIPSQLISATGGICVPWKVAIINRHFHLVQLEILQASTGKEVTEREEEKEKLCHTVIISEANNYFEKTSQREIRQ